MYETMWVYRYGIHVYVCIICVYVHVCILYMYACIRVCVCVWICICMDKMTLPLSSPILQFGRRGPITDVSTMVKETETERDQRFWK